MVSPPVVRKRGWRAAATAGGDVSLVLLGARAGDLVTLVLGPTVSDRSAQPPQLLLCIRWIALGDGDFESHLPEERERVESVIERGERLQRPGRV